MTEDPRGDGRRKVIVRRRFAVWAEDAFEVTRPSDNELALHGGDIDAWATTMLGDLYERSGTDPSVRMLYEDRFVGDVVSHDDEIVVEEP